MYMHSGLLTNTMYLSEMDPLGWIEREYTYDTMYTYPTRKFISTGYTFTGWGTTATSGVNCPVGAAFANLTTTGNVDRYAQWTKYLYRIFQWK